MEGRRVDCRIRPPQVGMASQEQPQPFASQNSQPGAVDALVSDNRKNKALSWVYIGCCHTVHIQPSCVWRGCQGGHMYHSAPASQKAPLPQCPSSSEHSPAPTKRPVIKNSPSPPAYWEHPKERKAWQPHPFLPQPPHLVAL